MARSGRLAAAYKKMARHSLPIRPPVFHLAQHEPEDDGDGPTITTIPRKRKAPRFRRRRFKVKKTGLRHKVLEKQHRGTAREELKHAVGEHAQVKGAGDPDSAFAEMAVPAVATLGGHELWKLYERVHKEEHNECGACCHDRPAKFKAELLHRLAENEGKKEEKRSDKGPRTR